MQPTIVSAGVDTRLIHVLARMAMHVLDTGSAMSGSTTQGRSDAQTPRGSICISR
jgi:hypothetical protein